MVSPDFAQAMRHTSDEELWEIVKFGKEEDFALEAIAAAETELAARNLNPTHVAAIAATVNARREQRLNRASAPLSWPSRLAFFVLPFGCLTIVVLGAILFSLERAGYARKRRQHIGYSWRAAHSKNCSDT